MAVSEERLNDIINGLHQKSVTKQAIYRNTKATFDRMKEIAQDIVKKLTTRITKKDADVIIEYINISEFEFHVKFSGDMLMFIMHTNIITFPEDYELMKNDYIEEDFRRRFFGHIMAYNFMADTIKYNRMDDPGYLVGRMLINIDRHFVIEGVKQMELPYDRIAQNVINNKTLRLIIESAMVAAVNNDLMGQDVSEIERITLKQKQENVITQPRKLGFQVSSTLTH
ncbi:hypothetical protein JAO76_00665 [Pontibacter sp. BT310]|jgi:hypothetical protein|uniref:Uncharacterized protein n=1 Tax=Pontibacter populi TaxID=890055 RepID=A0ABS6X6B4_9BACT|nr:MULTISPECIES: hypothetical protein [Pontibacter]MBJ6116684.1 hypothetical protein [Pontibacter sp. BT310]MBR0569108.1 hypothetical protein [Microvirga sp. STS03]MBW3363538.1 hypothetical protein [Pontibacter populi]